MLYSPSLSHSFYRTRLGAAVVLGHVILALVLLHFSPWPVPPIMLLGYAVAPLLLDLGLLVLTLLLLPGYDGRERVRGTLIGAALLLGVLL